VNKRRIKEGIDKGKINKGEGKGKRVRVRG